MESTLYDHIREFHVHDMLAVPVKSFFRQIKTIIWLSTTFIIILVMAAAYYVLSMIKVLFDAMIVMKNAQVPETGFLNKLEEIKLLLFPKFRPRRCFIVSICRFYGISFYSEH